MEECSSTLGSSLLHTQAKSTYLVFISDKADILISTWLF